MAAPIGLRLLLDGMSWKRKNPTEPASSALEGSSLALGDVQVCASQGRRGRNTGSYVDRGERREVRAWAPRSAKELPSRALKHDDDQQCGNRADHRAAVAEHSERSLQPLELQSVMQRVTESVRPVEQHQNEQTQCDQPGEPEAEYRMQMTVVGLHPSQRDRQPKQEH